MPSLTELFALRLEQEMENRGLSANALAKVSGVGQRSISRILRKEQSPGLDIVEQLALALGLPAVWLLEARGSTSKNSGKVVPLPNPYPPIFAAKQHEGKYRSRRGKRE